MKMNVFRWATMTLLCLSLPVLAGQQPQKLSDLPALAQITISQTIGKDQSSFHATKQSEGYRFTNDGLTTTVSANGLAVGSSSASVLKLDAIGRGKTLNKLADAEPEATANHVELNRGAVKE